MFLNMPTSQCVFGLLSAIYLEPGQVVRAVQRHPRADRPCGPSLPSPPDPTRNPCCQSWPLLLAWPLWNGSTLRLLVDGGAEPYSYVYQLFGSR